MYGGWRAVIVPDSASAVSFSRSPLSTTASATTGCGTATTSSSTTTPTTSVGTSPTMCGWEPTYTSSTWARERPRQARLGPQCPVPWRFGQGAFDSFVLECAKYGADVSGSGVNA